MASMLSLTDALKKLDTEPSQARELRALFIAQIVGYKVPLGESLELDELIEHYRPKLTKILNALAQTTAVDIRLCQAYFAMVIRTRWQILNGVSDPVLLRYLVDSQTQADNAPSSTRTLLASLASRSEFEQAARQAMATVGELLGEKEGE